MKFLVIRFRQMGDAVISTSLLNAIKKNFPDSEVHFVMNENIASLFEGHPSIDRVIKFSKDERHSTAKYLGKIRKLMKAEKYDVIIDMRCTLNTLPFTIFSRGAKYRIGIRKPYTKGIFTHLFDHSGTLYMGTQDTNLLSPLQEIKDLDLTPRISLKVTEKELNDYHRYLAESGVDFSRPILLCGVVAKDDDKNWNHDRMKETLERVIRDFPETQLIFNYAPGKEEKAARAIYKKMGNPANVLIDVKAPSMRHLMCLARECDAYFGNEGGARHIVEAMGRPSLVIGSPTIPKRLWIQESDTARSITVSDIDPNHSPSHCDCREAYDKITVDEVYSRLKPFLSKFLPHED